jgi:Copper transport outer membrane protein, MctB
VIRSRAYAVPLVAVLLALATGVALGAGPLTSTRSSAEPGPVVTSQVPQSRYPDTFAASVASRLYAAGLSRRPVALVPLPGADPATVAALTTQIRAAGGELTGTFPVDRQLVDPGQKNLVDTLGSQLRLQLRGNTVDKAASTYPRIGQLIAVAIANRTNAVGQPDADAAAVRQSLVAAHLLVVPKGGPPTAPLVLVVLGTALDQSIADGLLDGLAAGARGVVAVGPTRAVNLVGLHQDGVTRHVTTVDGTETGAGRVAAVLALIRAWHTQGGAFGASGSDGAVPLG